MKVHSLIWLLVIACGETKGKSAKAGSVAASDISQKVMLPTPVVEGTDSSVQAIEAGTDKTSLPTTNVGILPGTGEAIGPLPGTVEITEATTSTLTVKTVAAASGPVATTFRIYFTVGSFSSDTTQAIETEGTLANTATAAGIFTITGLSPATQYAVGVVASIESEKSKAKTVFPPKPGMTAAIPLTNGALSINNVTTSGFSLTIGAAFGSEGIAYQVYTIAGAFSAATVGAVEAEGVLKATVSSTTNAVDIGGLSPNTSYQVTVITSAPNSTKHLYTPITQVSAGARYIFVVAAPNGNLGGIAGADKLCQSKRPTNVVSAKAMLSDGATRIACTTAFCATGGNNEHKDWVLAPTTTYRNIAEKTIGTTTPAGVFQFPLTNPVEIMTNERFSGIGLAWGLGTTYCNGWTTDLGEGEVGNTGYATNRFNFAYSQFCSRTNVKLACAEQ